MALIRMRRSGSGQGSGAGGGGNARADHALQPLGGVRLVRLHARHHFIEHHRQRPQVRIHVDLARIQPLRRSVGHAAEFVARQPARKRERLGDAEIEHAHFAVRIDADVLRLDVAVHDAVKLLAVDGRPAELCAFSRVSATRDGHFGGELEEPARPRRISSARSCPSMYSMATIEETVDVAAVVDADHARVDGRQVAPAVRRRGARPRWHRGCRRRGVLDQLQRHGAAGSVSCARYTSAIPPRPSLLADLVLAEFRGRPVRSFFPCPRRSRWP